MAALKYFFVDKMMGITKVVGVMKFWVGVTRGIYGIYPTKGFLLRVLGETLMTLLVN